MSHPSEKPTLRCQSVIAELGRKCGTPLGFFVPGTAGQELHTFPSIQITTRPDGLFVHCPSCGGGYVWYIGRRRERKPTPKLTGSVTGVGSYAEVKHAGK